VYWDCMVFKLSLFIALWALSGTACAAENVVLYWNNAALQAIRAAHAGPPQAARMLAMAHTCMYDAWAGYDPVAVGTRLGGQLRRPASEATAEKKRKAISFAAYRCLLDLFPRQRSFLDKEMTRLGYDSGDNSHDLTAPAGIGNTAADEVIRACHHDGANQLGDLEPGPYEDYTAYTPVNGPELITDPDRWQPLRVIDHGDLVIQRYIAPFWGRVTPFALTSEDQFRPAPPYSYAKNREQYVQQALDLIDISTHLTERQKVIADYWADGPLSETPPGHWCLLAQFVSARDHHDVDADVKMFFALTNALFDASIVTWDTKRAYDSVRPITAIHFLFAGKKIRAWAGSGKGSEEMDGANWQPYQQRSVVTPAFPEYISGHSTFSGAAAEVLRLFTGSDAFGMSARIKTGSSRIEPLAVPAHDVTLKWNTFSEAADQAGLSRRYGGIHFELGDMTGRRIGRLVGAQAYAKAASYFAVGKIVTVNASNFTKSQQLSTSDPQQVQYQSLGSSRFQ
jgi:hypothetical protein